jgi:hypothetical protein
MGLLDDFAGFIKTPEGQGLLSGVAGWAAGARKGTPWNNIGRGGLAGMMGYGNALEQQTQAGQAEQAKKLRDMQISEMLAAKAQKDKIQGLAMNSVLSPESQAIGKFGPTPEGAAAISQFKPTFDTEGFLSGMMGIDPMQAMTLKKSMEPKPMTVGKNDRVVLPTTGGGYKTVLDALPSDESVPSAIKEYQFAKGQGFNGTFQDFTLQQKRAGAGQTNVFNNTKDNFKNERDLRNDFAGLPTTKAFNEVQSAHDQIKVAIKKESPAGDLAAATKIMKILDPGSVVRESELGMAMAATGAMDRVSNYAGMVMSGAKLTPSQRKDFSELATQLYSAAAGRYNSSADEFRGIASDYGLKADRIAKNAVVRKYNPKTGKIE